MKIRIKFFPVLMVEKTDNMEVKNYFTSLENSLIFIHLEFIKKFHFL